MLHKPAGNECSQKPSAWPSIYTLLPAPLRQRPSKGAVPGVQAIGRLDQDTTGLLLLSDDGSFIHRMGSPAPPVPKVYEVTLAPGGRAQVQQLLDGVVLDDDPKPVRAPACELTRPAAPAADPDRGQVPPGQAHGGGGGQPGRGPAPLADRRLACRTTRGLWRGRRPLAGAGAP